jgi:hypothetical protein
MAITLSTSSSALLEPKRKSRWLVSFDRIPGSDLAANTALSFACYKGTKPDITMDKTELNRLNERWKFANRPAWNDLEFSFYDFIRKDVKYSAFSIMKEWWKKVYNPITGQMGYASEYKTNFTLAMLDPHGAVVQTWHVFYAYPQSTKHGDLDYGSDDLVDVSVTIAYDYAIPGEEISGGMDSGGNVYPSGFDLS